MKRSIVMFAAGMLTAIWTAGCASNRPNPGVTAADRERGVRLMLNFDANSDGIVTRSELEAGLHRQFMAVDKNGDGRLDSTEVRAENDRRWAAAGTESSPLMDWNQDGNVDFDEFATTARSVFENLDLDHDGMLSADELRLAPARAGMRGAGQQQRRMRNRPEPP